MQNKLTENLQRKEEEIRELKENVLQLRREIEQLKSENDLFKSQRDEHFTQRLALETQVSDVQLLVQQLCIENDKHCDSSTALNSEFSMQELQQATENFSETLKIGQGGFGPVYKGSLRRIMVAIKFLNSPDLHGISQFQQEVYLNYSIVN